MLLLCMFWLNIWLLWRSRCLVRVYLRLWCVHVCVVCLLELVIRVLADVIRVLDDSVPGEPRRSVGGMHV